MPMSLNYVFGSTIMQVERKKQVTCHSFVVFWLPSDAEEKDFLNTLRGANVHVIVKKKKYDVRK